MLTFAESVLAFWATEVQRKALLFSLNCAGCVIPLLRSQFIPVISKDPTVNVVNFARTRMWFLPGVSPLLQKCSLLLNIRYTKPLAPYQEITKWVFSHIPFVQRVYRFMIAASVCSVSILFRLSPSLTRHAARDGLSYLQSKRQQLHEQTHDQGNVTLCRVFNPLFVHALHGSAFEGLYNEDCPS